MPDVRNDDWVALEPEYDVVDRSMLEAFDCPRQGAFLRDKLVISDSLPASSGQAVHDALSGAVTRYLDSDGVLNQTEIAEEVRTNLLYARPDIQHDAIRGVMKSVYEWSRMISRLSPGAILKYDGGRGSRSGQLAVDFPDLRVRATSEIDFLHAGPSADIVHELDYKSGQANWTQNEVYESFQFRFHALLIFTHFPKLKAVEVSVWNTRKNQRTYSVIFDRERSYDELLFNVRMRCEAYRRWRNQPPEKCDVFPTIERCSLCPGAAKCKASGQVQEAAEDPVKYLKDTIAMQAAVDARKQILAGIVKQRGEDLKTPEGDCFGIEKPKSTRKPTMEIYTGKGDE